MMRSLYAGVSGLKNHQTRMDVIGNNIANVNTTGYKKSRVVFKDTLYQSMRGASSPVAGTSGGTNPMAVGLGMSIASIDQIHTGAPTTTTNKATDMAVDGNGYFIVNNGGQRYYTRAGNFDFDTNGNLESLSNGYLVQGWNADAANNYALDTSNDPTGINIAGYKNLAAKQTTDMVLSGNLDSSTAYTASRDEWQTLTFNAVNPIGGTVGQTFNLTLNGNTTANIAVANDGVNLLVPDGAATAGAIQAALVALPNVGTDSSGNPNVAVTWDAVRQRYDIKFQGNLAKTDMPTIVYAAVTTTATGTIATLDEGQTPLSPVAVNEVQTLDLTTATAGNCTLTYGGGPAITVNYGDSAATIQAALYGDPALNGNVTVTQTSAVNGGAFSITFNNALAGTNVNQMVLNGAGLTGTGIVSTTTQGQPADNPLAANTRTFAKDVYDSQGNPITVNYRFFKYEVTPGSNPGVTPVVDPVTKWACDISLDPTYENQTGYNANTDLRTIDLQTGTASAAAGTEKMTRIYNIDFDANGAIINPTTANTDISLNLQVPPPGSGTYNMSINNDFSKLTQIAASSSAWVESQDGYGAGTLTSYSVGVDGKITGTYDNGEKKALAQVALANFENPSGLQEVGGTLFQRSSNSGDPRIGAPNVNGLGKIAPGSLEMSNVDLSEEFTDMIITERGFQANSKIITTSDEMLQELVNLKR